VFSYFFYRLTQRIFMKRRLALWIVALSSLWASAAGALGLGDAAPRLSPSEWVQGSAVDLSDRKNVYVLDFWATWCRPCRETIPHMSELQAKYKGQKVVVVGISDETKSLVAPFVTKMGSAMEFRVAVDPKRDLTNKYGDIPEFRGIPFAVIIDTRGDIAWFGHPLDGLDEALASIVAGTYSISDQLKLAKAKKLLPAYIMALASGDKTGARGVGEKLLVEGSAAPNLLNEFAWMILTEVPEVDRDVEIAKKAAGLAFEASGKSSADIADTYALALFQSKDTTGAIKYQKLAISLCKRSEILPEMKKTLARYEAALSATD
jgi:thiol-disulfide isomerase/thioredoxin